MTFHVRNRGRFVSPCPLHGSRSCDNCISGPLSRPISSNRSRFYHWPRRHREGIRVRLAVLRRRCHGRHKMVARVGVVWVNGTSVRIVRVVPQASVRSWSGRARPGGGQVRLPLELRRHHVLRRFGLDNRCLRCRHRHSRHLLKPICFACRMHNARSWRFGLRHWGWPGVRTSKLS